MDINWLFAQYVMRNTICFIKITHVIFAKCYYSLFGQYLKTGWVNRLSRSLNRFSSGGNRLNRYKNRLNQFWPPPRPCCQSAPSVSQTALSVCHKIRAVNPFLCAFLLCSLTRNRLNRFSVCWPAGASPISLPFLSYLLLSSLSQPTPPTLVSLSLSSTLSPLQNPLVPSNLWKFCWKSVHLGVLYHLPRSCSDFLVQTPDRGIVLVHLFLLNPIHSWLSSVSFVGYILV
jgi:hypothetical protein